MNRLFPLAGALGLVLLSVLPVQSFAEGEYSAPYGGPDSLTRTTIGFAESTSIVPEGTGKLDIELVVEAGGNLEGKALIKVAKASTAKEGVDYKMTGQALDLSGGTSGTLKISLDILDNTSLGGRYLILEIELPDSNLLVLGKRGYHIVLIQDTDARPPAASAAPRLKASHLSSYAFSKGASAEILAYDALSSRLFVSNLSENKLEVLDFSDPSKITPVKSIHLDVFGGHINAVAAHAGIVALAIEGEVSTDPGKVVFLDTNGVFLSAAPAGAMPDMLLFSHDGNMVLAANEGEPNQKYTADPEGSISIIDISRGVASPVSTEVNFRAYNDRRAELAAQGVRIFGPGATVAQDLEPEYIALSDDGSTAYVTCQENNALAVINLAAREVSAILPLGYKDWTAEGLTLDVSNRAGGIFFSNWPIKGMYQPDAIDYFTVGGKAYLITANEGDARNYKGYTEEFRVKDKEIMLDEEAFPDGQYLKEDALLGRLRVSLASGDTDGDGRFEELYTFGGRSFAIWDAATGGLVYDSGNALEQITAADPVFGRLFNTQNNENDFKSRSDDKGPEPASVKVADINGTLFALIGLERIGGMVVFRLANPAAPEFVQYINTRTVDSLGGDLSPEGLIYIAPEDSPTGRPYALAAHEVSGSVAVFELGTAPVASFASANSIIEEGAGELRIELVVEKPGTLAGEAQVRVIAPSSAREGADYVLGDTSVAIGEGHEGPYVVKVNIPDNDVPGSRYLILEIDPEKTTVNIGETSRHIVLIQDNDEKARR